MNVYLNCKPNNYNGDSDLLTLDVPSGYTEELLRYVRPIADEKNVPESKILKDIITESINEIQRRDYEGKNRKNKRR